VEKSFLAVAVLPGFFCQSTHLKMMNPRGMSFLEHRHLLHSTSLSPLIVTIGVVTVLLAIALILVGVINAVPRPVPLRPSRRGERTCLCSGVLQETKGHYGWILPRHKIDHPDAQKHQGAVYLDTRDIRPGSRLCKSDEVVFFLYSDSRGLAAEDCHLKSALEDRLLAQKSHNQRAGEQSNLSIGEFLDNVDGKLGGALGPRLDEFSDTDSTGSGTRSPGSGSSSPRQATSPRFSDIESDPLLRMLQQPREKEPSRPSSRAGSSLSKSKSTAGSSQSKSKSATASAAGGPADHQESEKPPRLPATPVDDDLFESLRAELREAWAKERFYRREREADARASLQQLKTTTSVSTVPVLVPCVAELSDPQGEDIISKATQAIAHLGPQIFGPPADCHPSPGFYSRVRNFMVV